MANDAVRTPHAQGFDFGLATFSLEVEGRELGRDETAGVSEVVFRDSLDDVGSLEVILADGDGRSTDARVVDGDRFLPGKRLRAALGHRDEGELRPVFDGRIVSLEPEFPRDGRPRVVVRALDLLHELRREQRSAVYEDKTDSEIAREVALRIGVDVRTHTGGATEPRHPFVFQRNQYDVLFLRERARAAGYDLVIDLPADGGPASLVFGPTQSRESPEYSLLYGRTLLAFHASLDASRRVSEVVVRAWDPLEKTLVEAVAANPRVRTVGDATGRTGLDAAASGRREIVLDAPVTSQEQAASLAAGLLDDIARETILASAETFGLPHLRAGVRVVLDGVGTRFGGAYLVTSSTHRLGEQGYTTSFHCRKEDVA